MIKDLTKKYWENLLNDNFSPEDVKILHNELNNPRNQEFQIIIEVFELNFPVYNHPIF